MFISAWIRSTVWVLVLAIGCWGMPSFSVSALSLTQSPSSKIAMFSFPGNRPSHLGVQNNQLMVCPSTPNCVSSQAPASDAAHYIAPIAYRGSSGEAIAQLKALIEGQERTAILESTDNYLYAEFTSKLMGFVDDVEFHLDERAKIIQVRSASRLGESDLGVNRQRIEALRAAMASL